jgi:hypothetical protein
MAAWSRSQADENDTFPQPAGVGVFACSKEPMSFGATLGEQIIVSWYLAELHSADGGVV